MVVGAPDYGIQGWKEDQGHAYVYRRDDSSNEYEMIQEFAGFHTDSDNGFDGFGFAVDMSADGNTILVAAGSNWYNGGYIRMFKRSDSSSSYEQYVSIHFMSLSPASHYIRILFSTQIRFRYLWFWCDRIWREWICKMGSDVRGCLVHRWMRR